ncbi:hypothetical protein, partial [Pseudomonas fluorescens]|uniref:hypothetical protein n=1 Tax=Pseudomonas fluorescens TaxID=294 RepID=UPI003F8D390A
WLLQTILRRANNFMSDELLFSKANLLFSISAIPFVVADETKLAGCSARANVVTLRSTIKQKIRQVADMKAIGFPP